MHRLLPVLALPVCLPGLIFAQDASFLFSTTRPAPYVSSFVGNGYFSLTTTPDGLRPAESFAARVYDHAKSDIPRIAALPAWNSVDISNGLHWLNEVPADSAALGTYNQQIDAFKGVLSTRYEWKDNDRTTAFAVDAFVSRSDEHLAVIRVDVTPRYAGRITVSFSLAEWNPPTRLNLAVLEKLEPDSTGRPPGLWTVWHPGFVRVDETGIDTVLNSIWLVAHAEGSQTSVAEVAAVSLPGDLRRKAADWRKSTTRVSFDVSFDAERGRTYRFTKYVAIVTSRETGDVLTMAKHVAESSRSAGYEKARSSHEAAWHRLWDTDIVIEGDASLQKAVHSMMFYLLCSVAPGTEMSIPPMGLSSPGYYGHVFWDADTYILPSLLLMHPELAESMVTFRYRALEAAKRNAAKNGYAGAMYPWESDEVGDETTPRFAAQNATHEIHITGDVALGQWQYFLATGDRGWLRTTGYPVIKETADYWVSRVSYDREKSRYDIRDVVSVDEGLIGISNDAYTNAIAKKNLQLALKAGAILGTAPDPRWRTVEEKLFIPYDSVQQFHPTYENAPASTHGAVTALLEYPLEIPMSPEAARNNLAWAAKRFVEKGGGAMMGEAFYPLIAAELRDSTLFQALVPKTYQPHLRGDFWALAETPGNDAINFLTGAGAFLQQVIFGYSGLRLEDSGLQKKFAPMLPSGVDRVTLKDFTVRGKRCDIVIQRNVVTVVEK